MEIVLRVASAGYDLWYVPAMRALATGFRRGGRRSAICTSINRGLGVSQALADALVWDGSQAAGRSRPAAKLLKDLFRSRG